MDGAQAYESPHQVRVKDEGQRGLQRTPQRPLAIVAAAMRML